MAPKNHFKSALSSFIFLHYVNKGIIAEVYKVFLSLSNWGFYHFSSFTHKVGTTSVRTLVQTSFVHKSEKGIAGR